VQIESPPHAQPRIPEAGVEDLSPSCRSLGESTPAPAPRRLRPRALLVLGTLLWLSGIALGLASLWRYQRSPGARAEARSEWPKASAIARPTDRPVLLQFIHPHCQCSSASLSELAKLLGRVATPPAVYILFMRPDGLGAGWEESRNWAAAHRIAGASVLVDLDGAEARHFGAKTSGQTFVYGVGGELLFDGGLTSARGEVGDSVGGLRVLATLGGVAPDRRESSVFGCSLDDPEAAG